MASKLLRLSAIPHQLWGSGARAVGTHAIATSDNLYWVKTCILSSTHIALDVRHVDHVDVDQYCYYSLSQMECGVPDIKPILWLESHIPVTYRTMQSSNASNIISRSLVSDRSAFLFKAYLLLFYCIYCFRAYPFKKNYAPIYSGSAAKHRCSTHIGIPHLRTRTAHAAPFIARYL